MAETKNDPKRVGNMISRLPDEVLLTILEKLPLEDAVITGFLSHRWRHLWKYITYVDFGPWWVESTGKEIVPSLSHFVSLHQGHKIRYFYVKFTYKPAMANQVNSWILFAVMKNVEKLYLDFDGNEDNKYQNSEHDPCYELLPCVFNCESLDTLFLKLCHLKLPDSIHLRNLRTVYFQQIELPDQSIQKLTSNTPVLETLILHECNRTRDLHINIAPNPHFYMLEIIDKLFEVDSTTTMEINAPSVRSLILSWSVPRSKYRIKNVSQCHEVKLDLLGMLYHSLMEEIEPNVEIPKNYEELLLELLSNFQHAKILKMCTWCLQILSQRQVHTSTRLSFLCTHLQLVTCFQKWEQPGIAYMLKACRDLENLLLITGPLEGEILMPHNFKELRDFEERTYWRNQKQSLAGHLQNLKTVEFKETGEGHQTWKDGCFNLSSFFNKKKNGMNLLKILMDTSKTLERVVFSTDEQRREIYLRMELLHTGDEVLGSLAK